MAAGSFGLLALFARALGGYALGQGRPHAAGLDSRVDAAVRLDRSAKASGLLWFAQAPTACALAVVAMLIFGLFTHMACGATYALVPFIDRKALWAAWPASSAPAATSARSRRAS